MSGHSQRILKRSRETALAAVTEACAQASRFGTPEEITFWQALVDLIEVRYRAAARVVSEGP